MLTTKKAARKESSAKKKGSKEIPYVLKDKYLQVTIEGKPFSLDSTHPTFEKMAKAIRDKNWKAIPRLVTIAQSLFSASQGNVTVKNGIVHYKGSPVDDGLARYIVQLIKDKREVNHMLLFMDKLYRNPSPEARAEFFSWFRTSDLPITDDGCFLAYKSVDANLRDEHTHTIDNSPGQRILGSREWFDNNYRTQCSSGYHVCSKEYGLYGSRVMAVKVDPEDILSCEGGKMRVVNYEVLYELGTKTKAEEVDFKRDGFTLLEKKVLVEFAGERKELIKLILNSPQIKRAIRDKKISEATIKKAAQTRLKSIAQRYGLVDAEPVTRKLKTIKIGQSHDPTAITQGQVVNLSTLPVLKAARKAAGFTVGQIAKTSGIAYKTVAELEGAPHPEEHLRTKFLEAIWILQGKPISGIRRGAITFPKAMKVA